MDWFLAWLEINNLISFNLDSRLYAYKKEVVMARRHVRRSDPRGTRNHNRGSHMTKSHARIIRDRLISKRARGEYLSSQDLDDLHKAIRFLRG
jgi:hypothetical protein